MSRVMNGLFIQSDRAISVLAIEYRFLHVFRPLPMAMAMTVNVCILELCDVCEKEKKMSLVCAGCARRRG